MNKNIKIFGYSIYLEINKIKKPAISNQINIGKLPKPYKLNFGPGPNWKKPDKSWLSVDIDPSLGDIIVNFQEFEKLPIDSNSVEYVYGSHVFEHISIFKSQLIFDEIYRVLTKNGIFRLILPDTERSINEYIKGNQEFELFKRRKERAKKNQKIEYTLFECMREDFLSPNGQSYLLGKNTLAHQNAWDFETIKTHLIRAKFKENQIFKSGFQKSNINAFNFEGSYVSEANQAYRSLYVEAIKA